MNTKVIIAVVIGIVVLAGGFFYLSDMNNSQNSQMAGDQAMMTEDNSAGQGEMMEKEDQIADDAMNDSRYVPYSKSELDSAAGTRRVLYFYANWCPTCRPADENFRQEQARIPEDVTVIRVNYNDTDTDQEEKDLAQKYGITYQHTFVQIDRQGNEVAKWNGGQLDELLTQIR